MAEARGYEDALVATKQLQSINLSLDKYQQSRHNTLDSMHSYVRRVNLEEQLAKLSVVHIAGTKGKGSTCAFTESLLRANGLRTGLYTSPHLIEITERFKLNGVPISKELFASYFWQLWDQLKGTVDHADGFELMPNFFRFMTLLAFKIFAAEKLDVCIIEVGIGGRLDATNVIPKPVVCGVTSLGFDHMELLGDTLDKIAWEKAGIFKPGVPAYTVPQDSLAMSSLLKRANELQIPLQIAPSLSTFHSLSPIVLGLQGRHQHYNASLALCLAHEYLLSTSKEATSCVTAPQSAANPSFAHSFPLTEAYLFGLKTAAWPGRCQTVVHPSIPNLTFYLDGAHTQESTQVCADWFSEVTSSVPSKSRFLMFNCAPDKDPSALLRPLSSLEFHQTIFCPMVSSKPAILPPSSKVGSIQPGRTWQNVCCDTWTATGHSNGQVIPSLAEAQVWFESYATSHPSEPVSVLVTGSLYLVGDVLKSLISRPIT